MKTILTWCICICILSCNSNKVPKDILPPEKMKTILWDYISTDIYAADYLSKDPLIPLKAEKTNLQESIFSKNKTDRGTFSRSYAWYEAHDEVMKVMLDSMIAVKTRELEKERIKIIKAGR